MKNELILKLGILFSFFHSGFYYTSSIAIAEAYSDIVKSDWVQGLLFACFAGAGILSALIYSSIDKKFGSSKVYFIGGVIHLLSVLQFYMATSVFGLAIARMEQGIASVVIWTGGPTLIAQLFPKSRNKILSFALMTNSIGGILGPIIGGYLIDNYNVEIIYFGFTVFCLIDIFMRFKVPSHVNLNEKFISLKILIYDKQIISASLIIFISAWFWSVLESLLPMHLLREFRSTSVGLFFTIGYVFYAAACPIIAMACEKFSASRVIFIGLWITFVAYFLLCISENILSVGLLMIVVSVCYGITINPSFDLLADSISSRNSSNFASAYSLYNITYSLGMLFSNLFCGLVSSAFSFQESSFSTLLLILFGTFLFYQMNLKEENMSFSLPKTSESDYDV